jgi:hypothetical protein
MTHVWGETNMMTSLNRIKVIRIIQTMVAMVCVVVVFGNGCSEGAFVTNDGTSDSGSNGLAALGPQCKSATEIDVIPGARTVSFVGSNLVLRHLSNCIGLAVPSGTTETVYEEKKGSISTYGEANTITAPMMMAITSLAGEICSDLIDQEVASGVRIFSGFNLGGNALPSSANLTNAVGNIALSCWRGNESAEERAAILDMVNSNVGAAEAGAARKAALMICTSMLSSVDALLN